MQNHINHIYTSLFLTVTGKTENDGKMGREKKEKEKIKTAEGKDPAFPK